jgi:acyl-CoA thioester hydrolase
MSTDAAGPAVPAPAVVTPSHTMEIRVRYPEVDAMGYLHHSRYLQYFEMGRVELLRSMGHSYADLERAGVFFVVVKAEVRYKAPARYDEVLTLVTTISKQTTVRIDHVYQLRRGETLLAEASTTIACVDRTGQLIPIPDYLAAGASR